MEVEVVNESDKVGILVLSQAEAQWNGYLKGAAGGMDDSLLAGTSLVRVNDKDRPTG